MDALRADSSSLIQSNSPTNLILRKNIWGYCRGCAWPCGHQGQERDEPDGCCCGLDEGGSGTAKNRSRAKVNNHWTV